MIMIVTEKLLSQTSNVKLNGMHIQYNIILWALLLCFTCSGNLFAASNEITSTTAPTVSTAAAPAETPTAAEIAIDIPLNTPVIEDNFPAFNHAMFTFNDAFDNYFWQPLAKFYNFIMPAPLNLGIHNAFQNIRTIPTIVNDVLQIHLCSALHDTWRFGINTTVGIGGLFDVASAMQLKNYTNDFGLTLTRWGYTHSSYLVLPFFGPFTIRDGAGFFIDYFAFSIYPYIHPTSLRYEVYTLGAIDRRANNLQFQNVVEEAALDKYIFMRNAYFQHRAYEIKNNEERTCT